MKRLGSVCLLALLVAGQSAQAGFFDDLKRQAEKAVQDAAKGVVDGAVPGQQEPPPPAEPQRQSSPPVADPRSAPAAPLQPQRVSQPGGDAPLNVHQVRGLQICLKRLGYYQGAPDGQYGPATATAIKHYQRARRMPVDGKATRAVQKDCGRAWGDLELRAELQKDAARRVPRKASTTAKGGQGASVARYTKYPTLDVVGSVPARNLNELFAVRFMPEAYSMEKRRGYYLEQAVSRLYPTEWRSARDEFERRRKLDELGARLREEAAKVPLVYRFVSIATLSPYDFQRQFFQINGNSQLPVVPDVSVVSLKLSMPPAEAEQFKKRCAGNSRVCRLYMEWIVEVVGSLGPEGALPIADVRQVHIYRTSNREGAPDALLSDLVMKVDLDAMPVNNYYVQNMGREPARAQKKKKGNSMEIAF